MDIKREGVDRRRLIRRVIYVVVTVAASRSPGGASTN